MAKSDTLIVAAVRSNGLIGRAIEWWGGGGWSHFTTLLPGGREVIDARSDRVLGVPAGVQVRPASYLEDYECLWLAIPTTAYKTSQVYAALHSQLGKPYDSAGIIAFATGDGRDRNWRDESAWFCSELAIWAQEQAGVCPQLPTPGYKITPGDALLVDAALGGVKTVGPG